MYLHIICSEDYLGSKLEGMPGLPSDPVLNCHTCLYAVQFSDTLPFHTYLQTPQILCSIVLFDPMTADFNIDGVWLVVSGGQQRPLNGTRAIQGVGIQINQKISPLDWVHVKVKVLPALY